MPKSKPTAIIFAWALLFVWVGFIFATLGTVPDWRDYLVEKYGEEIFTTITFGAGGVGLLILLVVMIFGYKRRGITPYFMLTVSLGFLTYVLLNWITLPVEQIHFVEYGIVGLLAFNALRHHLKGWGLVSAVIFLTFCFGMVDETVQGILPNRVGEQRDMYWNGLAGIIAMSIEVFSIRPKSISERSGLTEVRVHLIIIAICLIVQGYFNTTISQFGHLIHDKELNLSFKSRLLPDELAAYNDNLDHFKSNIAPRIGKMRMTPLLQEVYNLIHEEASVHCFRRAHHFRLGNIRTVYVEDQIIDKYFKRFVEGTELDWPRSLSEEMRPAAGERLKILYHSPVANHLITQ
ncbi:VanZ family protein, partial [bacterium]|nr:VanZ family protein [bacterium]